MKNKCFLGGLLCIILSNIDIAAAAADVSSDQAILEKFLQTVFNDQTKIINLLLSDKPTEEVDKDIQAYVDALSTKSISQLQKQCDYLSLFQKNMESFDVAGLNKLSNRWRIDDRITKIILLIKDQIIERLQQKNTHNNFSAPAAPSVQEFEDEKIKEIVQNLDTCKLAFVDAQPAKYIDVVPELWKKYIQEHESEIEIGHEEQSIKDIYARFVHQLLADSTNQNRFLSFLKENKLYEKITLEQFLNTNKVKFIFELLGKTIFDELRSKEQEKPNLKVPDDQKVDDQVINYENSGQFRQDVAMIGQKIAHWYVDLGQFVVTSQNLDQVLLDHEKEESVAKIRRYVLSNDHDKAYLMGYVANCIWSLQQSLVTFDDVKSVKTLINMADVLKNLSKESARA